MPTARDVLTPDALSMLQAIARTGSFAAAARAIGVVPSALTYRVRQIEEALDVLLGPGHGYGWDQVSATDLQDTVLGADESTRLFAVDWDDRLRKAFPGDARVEVRICYCSFLGECWTSRAGLDHDRVDQCPVAPAP